MPDLFPRRKNKDTLESTGINVCSLTLLDFHQQIGTLVLFHAKELIGIFDDCLLDVQKRMVKQSRLLGDLGVGDTSSEEDDNEEQSTSYRPNYTVKTLCHIRLSNLPPGFVRRNVSEIRSDDYGLFVQVSGTTIRTGAIKMLESEKMYQCAYAKCGHKFRVHADLEQGGVVEMPTKCPSSEFAATGQSRCKSTRFNFVEGSLICSDYQEIRIQEKPQSLGVGSIPRQICVRFFISYDVLSLHCKTRNSE